MKILKQVGTELIELSDKEIAEMAVVHEKFAKELELAATVAYKKERQVKFEKLDGDGMDAMRACINDIYSRTGIEPPEAYSNYASLIKAIKEEHPKPIKGE